MSDLEATRLRGQAATPIPNLARAKLGSLAARGVGPDDRDGVLDAFAEVFARMAASRPAANDPDHVAADVHDAQSGDHDQVDQSDATAEDSSEAGGLQPNSLVDPLQAESSNDIDHNHPLLASGQDDPGSATPASEDSNPQGVQPTVAPGPRGQEFSQDPEKTARDLLEGRKRKSPGDDPPVNTLTNADNTDEQHNPTGRPPSEQHVPESQLPATEASGPGAASEAADDTGDRHGRHWRRDQGDDHRPPGEVAGKPAHANAAQQLSNEPAGNLPGESLSERAAEQPTPPPEVTKAAAAAITGAPTIGSAATPQPQQARQSVLGGRGGDTGVTASLESTAAPKSETKSDAKGTTREGVSEAVNRAKLIQRVTRAFQHLGPDGGVVRLRLAPAELGTVRIEMRINGRKMDARVVAETEAASSALREHLPDLRGRLESLGMEIERIDIETDSGETDVDGRFQGQDGGDRRSNEQGPRSGSFRPRRDASVSRPVSSAAPQVLAETPITLTGIGVDLRL